MPQHMQQQLMEVVLEVLDTLGSSGSVAAMAADAERHQQAAGLASPLSAVELQRLRLLLHHACAWHLASLVQRGSAHALLRRSLADFDQLIELEGSGPSLPCLLRWRAFIHGEMSELATAVADLKAALTACSASPGEERAVAACESLLGFA